jgi:hypothetical protein
VETGTSRDDRPRARESDGWSTVAWGWYCSQTGGRAYTVDVDANALAVCRRLTAPYAAALEYVNADSVVFLRRWSEERGGKIDLLYPDSLDYFDKPASEAHCLAEVEAALPSMADACLILIDDTQPIGPPGPDGVPPLTGKGTRAVPYLVAQGFRLGWFAGNQVLLSRASPRREPCYAE